MLGGSLFFGQTCVYFPVLACENVIDSHPRTAATERIPRGSREGIATAASRDLVGVLKSACQEFMDVSACGCVEITENKGRQSLSVDLLLKGFGCADALQPKELVGLHFSMKRGSRNDAENPMEESAPPVVQQGVADRDEMDAVNHHLLALEVDHIAGSWRVVLDVHSQLYKLSRKDRMAAEKGVFTDAFPIFKF